ncbi:hypothetical protein HYN56_04490 [Flavobacterium crocinum]|uniref:DUF6881 domain-containing protein n=1 Tax=Flavobacterium crocinum TaxID=2183896 RepID=A0A2S1YHI7_9FLAO|nr:hypothetical protein [Flavobacterium crocinum]AWK03519.1 hypothetical protein HYN56_04490 [Flavobacterium crocinum]
MKYYKINWTHEFIEEPFLVFIEINENGFEEKKIEFYKDSVIKIASNDFERETFLNPDKFYIEDYNYQSYKERISAVEISKIYFNMEWEKAIHMQCTNMPL